jgi:(S)-2-hydroxyglutarate dehydrogenase
MEGLCIVGAGIVGLAVARHMALRYPGLRVAVIDKEPVVAQHQTGHNSGVVHAGLYYAPGSLKATLCRQGMGMLREFCSANSIAYRETGKLVVATSEDERGRLQEIQRRSLQNSVPGLRWLSAADIPHLEPNVTGRAALYSPRTATTDFAGVAHAFAQDIADADGRLHLGAAVTGITQDSSSVTVRTSRGTVRAEHAIICAGLHADRVAGLAGDQSGPAIVPFRGEYLELVPSKRDLVTRLVYPVPDPSYPFLGVHFTPRVTGVTDIGPNAVLAFAREGYSRREADWRDLSDVVRWPGFRPLARMHWRTGLAEMAGSMSKRVFLARARQYVPELRMDDVVPGTAGVRAQAVDRDGTLVDDYRIHHLGRVTAVRNAPSPAATSCMAIAAHISNAVARERGLAP